MRKEDDQASDWEDGEDEEEFSTTIMEVTGAAAGDGADAVVGDGADAPLVDGITPELVDSVMSVFFVGEGEVQTCLQSLGPGQWLTDTALNCWGIWLNFLNRQKRD